MTIVVKEQIISALARGGGRKEEHSCNDKPETKKLGKTDSFRQQESKPTKEVEEGEEGGRRGRKR